MKKQLLTCCLLVACSPLPCLAADPGQSGLYVGYSFGNYWIKGFNHNGFSRNDRDTVHGPYAGYRLHRYLAVEGQYLFQNETDERFNYEGEAAILSLRPTLPVTPGWEIYGKIGWAFVDGEVKRTAQSPAGSRGASLKRDKALFGLGTRWAMWRLRGRVEYQFDESVWGSDGPDLGFFTLGLEYEF